MSFFQAITGEITGRVLFGEEFADQKINGTPFPAFFAKLAEKVGVMVLDPVFQTFGKWPGRLGLVKLHKEVMQMIHDLRQYSFGCVQRMMEQSKQKKLRGDQQRNTFIDMLYDLKEQAEDYLTDWEIVDEFLALYLGGMDTTGHTLAMALYYLSANPKYVDQAREESVKYLKDQTSNYEDLNKMDLLNAIMKESLRLAAPTAITFERLAMKDHTLGELNIKKGTIIVIGNGVNGANPDYHDDPELFDPTRWMRPDSRTNKALVKDFYIFTPFHGGPRNCIGQYFAQVNFKIVLGLFLKKFDFKLADPNYKLRLTQRFMYEPDIDPSYTLTRKLSDKKD